MDRIVIYDIDLLKYRDREGSIIATLGALASFTYVPNIKLCVRDGRIGARLLQVMSVLITEGNHTAGKIHQLDRSPVF